MNISNWFRFSVKLSFGQMTVITTFRKSYASDTTLEDASFFAYRKFTSTGIGPFRAKILREIPLEDCDLSPDELMFEQGYIFT